MKFYLKRPWLLFSRLKLYLYEKAHPDEPWLSQGSIAFLKEHLQADMKVFEWGSGRSTLWFAQRVGHVVSVEYSQEWAKIVGKMLEDKQVRKVDLFYIPLEHPKSAPTPRIYDPIPKYVAKIFDYEKESFDLVVVDGHYRLTCVEQALDWIKPGGYMLIDNSNRVPREEWWVPPNWPLVHQSSNVKTQTSIWQKPPKN
ncbi:MAG: class I SAM-dependent methyltransferase [Bdellovibrionales bacterium]|nr:class I SAM-dependent methyltransferase [Bdellovibrionales bacterium]